MWKEYQDEHLEMAHIIQPGLDKLADYYIGAGLVPAYVLAMGMSSIITCTDWSDLTIQIAVNPLQELDWYQDHMLE